MQTSVPELLDFQKEPDDVIKRYGPDVQQRGTFASNCLTAAASLNEAPASYSWCIPDGTSTATFTQLEKQCLATDAPLVLWFRISRIGTCLRTPLSSGGRIWAYPIWPIPVRRPKETYRAGSFNLDLQLDRCPEAGKPGSTYGESDEFGWNVTKDPVHVHDMQATVTPLRYRSRKADLPLSGATVPPVRCSRTCQKRYAHLNSKTFWMVVVGLTQNEAK